ncbi:GIY-YIG nuclease family protein [Granulicella arctica]|uniref:hypothetical protein n=1 Tax=Granulicella arctica TaxID=940613 RepID=UPI0021DFA76D|nr:hypothetical protein [Granulicella arctica]
MTLTATISFGGDPQKATRMLVDGKQTTGKHYVYVHKGANEEIFYVGKGAGDRAYSKDRMPHWHHYVKTRCGGQYTVEIVRRFHSDEAALEFESDLIALYGHQLVNWQNSGRQTDLVVNARFHKLRKANWLFIAEMLPLESSGLVAAEERYQEAISRMTEYATLVWEVGLVAELSREISESWDCHLNAADLGALDRLSLLYKKQQRWQDLISAADSFFAMYPTTRTQGISIAILKRRDAAERKLKG